MYHSKNVPSASLIGGNSLSHGQHIDCGGSTMDPGSGGNGLSNNSNLTSKQRLRWTHELHERFVDAVAQLGGPDRDLIFLFTFSFSIFNFLHKRPLVQSNIESYFYLLNYIQSY